MSTMSLKIEIPLDDGWTCKSPESPPVRHRLEASTSKSPPSPEKLKKAEEFAALRAALVNDGRKARAARETQLVKEAKARRLRMEATSRQRLQDRLDTVAQREARLAAAKEKAQTEKHVKRALLEEAVKEAREAREVARQQRAAAELSRCTDASTKRGKVIQATVDRNAYQVKRALAVRTAVKEMERESAATAGEKMALKLLSAEERRLAAVRSPLDEAAERAADRAKQVAAQQLERLIKTEEKRRRLSLAMEKAGEKRETMITAISARASASNLKAAASAADAKEATEAGTCTARRQLFAKLNTAEVRRSLDKRKTSSKAEVIVVPVHPEVLPAPPAELAERLRGAPRKEAHELAACLATRHSAATSRLAAFRATAARKVARMLKRVDIAASRRTAARDDMLAKLERRAKAATHLIADARRAKLAFGAKAAARAKAAIIRRGAERAAVKRACQRSELKRRLAAGRLAVATLNKSLASPRGPLAAARRAAADVARAKRGDELKAKLVRANVARAAAVLAKASKAHLRTLPRTAPAKLTKAGGVLLKSEPASLADCASAQVEEKEKAVEAFSVWKEAWAAKKQLGETFSFWKEAAKNEKQDEDDFVVVNYVAVGC